MHSTQSVSLHKCFRHSILVSTKSRCTFFTHFSVLQCSEMEHLIHSSQPLVQRMDQYSNLVSFYLSNVFSMFPIYSSRTVVKLMKFNQQRQQPIAQIRFCVSSVTFSSLFSLFNCLCIFFSVRFRLAKTSVRFSKRWKTWEFHFVIMKLCTIAFFHFFVLVSTSFYL